MAAGVGSVLRALARAFATLNAPWYVFGAQAVLKHGVVRHTGDVDVTVSLAGTTVQALMAALDRAGFELTIKQDVESFIASTRVIPVRHRRSKIPVDVVLAGPGFEEEMLARRVHFELDGERIPYVSAEDLIVLKTLASRPKDLEDIRGVIRHQGSRLRSDEVRSRLRELEKLVDASDLLPTFEALLREPGTRPLLRTTTAAKAERKGTPRKPKKRS